MKFFIEFSSDKTQAETYVKIQRLHLLSIFIWIPIAIIVVGLSCVWSNISGQSTNYVNLSTQWQACLTQAQFVTIPLNATLAPVADQITATKNDFSNCIIGLVLETNVSYCSTTDGLFCVFDIQSTCTPAAVSFPVVENTQLPVGQLLNALSYIGIQAVIFSALGIGSLYRALKNPTWLPSTIALIIWTLFAIFTYYTVNPILPVPTQTNSTLLILLEYVTSNQKFNDYNNGDNHCNIAYDYLWIYLAFVLLLSVLTFFNILLAIFAELIKFNNPHKKHYESLSNTCYPNWLKTPLVDPKEVAIA